ncbi:MAG: ABC transporter substrate-binding protein [Dehalococcoidia bacterium]|nr:ABC transporter substrate-binding protein [Dehalococcoidia bacterium]MDD5494712.1 ABC transporter substrate-binding protein [Dehalococcoidia bacterium]
MKILVNILLASSAFLMILSGCNTSQQLHPVKGEFIEGQLGDDAQTLNWIIATDEISKRYASFMVDPLAVFDNNFSLQLRCLAKDIDVSPDGLVYTVTIRDDLRWTDGSTVTADDYVYTLTNIMFADWLECTDSAKWQENVNDMQVFVKPEVVNETTFKIVRQTVAPEFIYTIYALMPYPKLIAQHYENRKDSFIQSPEFDNMTYTGNLGAYKPVAWNAIDGFVVKRNPDYYLGKNSGAPYFDTYVIKLYGLQQMINDGLRDGKINYAFVEPQEANMFRGMKDVNVYTIPTGFCVYVAYNQRDNGWEGLKNAKVRQALSMIMDKAEIVSNMYSGYADPAFSFIPPYSPSYSEGVLNKFGMSPLQDQQKAINMIKEAGYEQKEIDGQMKFVDKDGKPIKLNFIVDIRSDFEQNLAIMIRQNLLRIGLDINPKFSTREILFADGLMNKVPGSEQNPAFNNGPGAVSKEPWDLVILSSHTNALTLEGSETFFTSKGKFNLFGFFNDKVDALYQRVKSVEAVNPENRKQIYAEISKVISDEQPVNFLVFYKDNYAFRGVKGVEPGINVLSNFQSWYFE